MTRMTVQDGGVFPMMTRNEREAGWARFSHTADDATHAHCSWLSGSLDGNVKASPPTPPSE